MNAQIRILLLEVRFNDDSILRAACFDCCHGLR
ncbi:MAG: hypothetical protein ACI97A_003037 [Planctomycetota bacterium]|jgi:hypothetical protein